MKMSNSFSSNSDDEFFDTVDASPKRRHVSLTSLTSIDVEEEELKILQDKKKLEEKRRQEDAELQNRLISIQQKKQRKKEKQILKELEAKKLAENTQRRMKLQYARNLISDDYSIKNLEIDLKKTLNIDVAQNTTLFYSRELDQNNILSNNSESRNVVEDCKYSETESESSEESEDNELFQSLLDQNASQNVNIDISTNDLPKHHTKSIPLSSNDDDEVDMPENLTRPVILDSKEPDIIKCARGKVVNNYSPVAPPRKKKNSKSDYCNSSFCESGISLEVDQIAKQFLFENEESLNLQSVTLGNWLVSANEEVSSKAEQTEEEREIEKRAIKRLSIKSATLPAKLSDEINSCNCTSKYRSSESFLTNKPPSFKKLERPRVSNEEILHVEIKNLDTGEYIPLYDAEEKIPKCVNPLSIHIIRRTQEYSSDSSVAKPQNDNYDDDEFDIIEHQKEDTASFGSQSTLRSKKKKIKIKRLIGKAVTNVRNKADKDKSNSPSPTKKDKSNSPSPTKKGIKMVLHHNEQTNDSSEDETDTNDDRRLVKVKASKYHKGPYDFDLLVPVQDLGASTENGAIWTMKFSSCGRLLATGGQDRLIKIWVLKDAYPFFAEERENCMQKVSPNLSQDCLNMSTFDLTQQPEVDEDREHIPFCKSPFLILNGHQSDILDLSWSSNFFILSSSMDKTVRLWHLNRRECLCCFQHIDFVTSIAFSPQDSKYFISGSLDGKLRLWNIRDKKVHLWNEVVGENKMITAINFICKGALAVVGTYDGRCVFYKTDQLKYWTQIQVKSTRGKNSVGRKITGIEQIPGEDKILVTSNDSRIRLYRLNDFSLICKYKGHYNLNSQIRATVSSNGKYIISGSEDNFVYIWRTTHNMSTRKDRNTFWEGYKAHQHKCTCAVFAPVPSLMFKPQFEFMDSDQKDEIPSIRGEVILSADFSGVIKIFLNKFKPGSGIFDDE